MGMTHSEAQQVASQQSGYDYEAQQRMAALGAKYGSSSSSSSSSCSSSNSSSASGANASAAGGGGKKRSNARMGSDGKTWVDKSLDEWPENDWRLFAGDLGNEVTDDLLSRAFGKYPSFAKAKVVRDKFTGKTKGFGFVSFIDPFDAAKAMREMNGKYVGNRPIRLGKSNWEERDQKNVKKKMKQDKKRKAALGLL